MPPYLLYNEHQPQKTLKRRLLQNTSAANKIKPLARRQLSIHRLPCNTFPGLMSATPAEINQLLPTRQLCETSQRKNKFVFIGSVEPENYFLVVGLKGFSNPGLYWENFWPHWPGLPTVKWAEDFKGELCKASTEAADCEREMAKQWSAEPLNAFVWGCWKLSQVLHLKRTSDLWRHIRKSMGRVVLPIRYLLQSSTKCNLVF